MSSSQEEAEQSLSLLQASLAPCECPLNLSNLDAILVRFMSFKEVEGFLERAMSSSSESELELSLSP